MDSSFWLGVLVTTVLAVPAGMLAIFLHGKLVQFLDSRRLISHENRKRAAVAFHKIILDLQNGRRDKNIYMLRIATGLITGTVSAISCIVGLIVVAALTPGQANDFSLESFLDVTRATHGMMLYLMFGSLFFMFITRSTLNRFRKITSALENFDRYEAMYRSKWGDTAED